MAFLLLRLRSFPICEQLRLEETLLRHSADNWCLINEGSPTTIVMGISGKEEELVHLSQASQDGIPLIKRFSGGGTVIVDENTLFVTFICQKTLHSFSPYPEPIMRWTASLYKKAFQHPLFSLRENDYVIGDKKCGGNAQYIRKERWLHHTSFVWDYRKENMDYLLHPQKTPAYREGRSHSDFLCSLKESFPCKQTLIEHIIQALHSEFPVTEVPFHPDLFIHPPLTS